MSTDADAAADLVQRLLALLALARSAGDRRHTLRRNADGGQPSGDHVTQATPNALVVHHAAARQRKSAATRGNAVAAV